MRLAAIKMDKSDKNDAYAGPMRLFAGMEDPLKQEGIAEGYLSACEQENRELRAEVARLQDDNRRLTECWETERECHDATHAEVERLREAAVALGMAHVAAQSKACPRCGYDRTQEP
jgi:hypothetical protein